MGHMPLAKKQQLIDALRNGDFQAYARIMRYYFNYVNKAALKITKDKEMAADVAFKVFIRLWNKRKEIPQGASILAHLYKYLNDIAEQ
jgi:DNA-directed RNA polymerase specialized sigma24 family protein